MKRLLSAVIGLALIAGVSQGQTPVQLQQKAFSTSSTLLSNSIDNVSFAAISGFSANPGPPRITTLNATCDRLSQNVQFYSCGQGYSIGGTNGVNGNTNFWATPANDSTGTNSLQPIAFTNVFLTNTICLIRHQAGDTYDRVRIYSCSISNVIFRYAPGSNAISGDILYPCYTNGFIPIAVVTGGTAVTLSLNSVGGIANGIFPYRPMLLETTGGTNQIINVVSGDYLP